MKATQAFAFLLLLSIGSMARSQWSQTNGPCGQDGPAFSICILDSTIFVGTDDRIYRSTNWGASWLSTAPPMTYPGLSTNVLGLLAHDQSVFAGIAGYGVFVSSDLGASWSSVDIPKIVGWSATTQFAASGNRIVAGIHYGVSFQSTDNGQSWLQIADPRGVSSVCIEDSVGLIGSGGIYRSVGGDTAWVCVRPMANWVDAIALSGVRALAGVRNCIFSSTDAGSTWGLDSVTMPCTAINEILFASSQPGSGFVFAGTDSGIFRSSDDGLTWNPKNSGLASTPVYALAFHPKGKGGTPTLFACTGAGVFISTDYGDTWVATGLPTGTSKIASDGQRLFAGATFTSSTYPTKFSTLSGPVNCTVYCSDDLGTTWRQRDAGLEGQSRILNSLAASPAGGGSFNLFAGLASTVMGRSTILGSTDNGLTWSTVFTDTIGTFPVIVSNPPFVFVGSGGNGVFRSSDNGITWTSSDSGLSMPPYTYPATVNAFSFDGEKVYAGGSRLYRVYIAPRTSAMMIGNYVYISTDNGASWAPVDSGFTPTLLATENVGSLLTCLYASGSHIVVGTRQWDFGQVPAPPTSGGIYHITGSGSNWALVDSALIGTQIYALAGINSDIFAGTNKGVFHSSDHGASWTGVNDGLRDTLVTSLAILNSSLFAATPSGVWTCPLSDVTDVNLGEVEEEVPRQFSLAQNYPNPFNPTTTIRYQLPVASQVRLAVYDLLGRLVATLVSERKEAGVHEIEFNAGVLSSGVYFYRLEAADFLQVKKLMVLK